MYRYFNNSCQRCIFQKKHFRSAPEQRESDFLGTGLHVKVILMNTHATDEKGMATLLNLIAAYYYYNDDTSGIVNL
jgi:hypothetical protein